jgi:hypothetical protein
LRGGQDSFAKQKVLRAPLVIHFRISPSRKSPPRRPNSMAAFPQLAWLEAFRDCVNSDPEMKLIGHWFTTSIALSFGDTRYASTRDASVIL